MSQYLTNKTVVVTGAAQGIGYAIADSIISNGAKITILLDVNETKGIETATQFNSTFGANKAEFVHCDVTKDLEAVSKYLFDKFGHIDVLVNNAGILDETSVKRALEVDLVALMEWTMRFWDHMRTDKGGQGGTIMNMSSILGFRDTRNFPLVTAAKHGVLGFSRCVGHQYNWNKYGVRVVALCPGKTDTPMAEADNFKAAVLNYEESVEAMRNNEKQPPEVVGRAAVQLLEMAPSGTAWLIEQDKPLQLINSPPLYSNLANLQKNT